MVSTTKPKWHRRCLSLHCWKGLALYWSRGTYPDSSCKNFPVIWRPSGIKIEVFDFTVFSDSTALLMAFGRLVHNSWNITVNDVIFCMHGIFANFASSIKLNTQWKLCLSIKGLVNSSRTLGKHEIKVQRNFYIPKSQN